MELKAYQHILFATDLGPQSFYIGQHAVLLANLCQGQLTAFHVVEPPLTYVAQFAENQKKFTETKEEAKKSLSALCAALKAPDRFYIETGSVTEEILKISRAHHIDLIIMGSHGVGGYTHMLGSTAHHILHEAPCDILIIQVGHLQKEIEKMVPQKGAYLWQSFIAGAKIFSPKQEPKLSGSQHGFGEVVQRGPRPTMRPGNTPYKGGTRKRTRDEDEETKDE